MPTIATGRPAHFERSRIGRLRGAEDIDCHGGAADSAYSKGSTNSIAMFASRRRSNHGLDQGVRCDNV
jgi:hypothetical protein